MSLNPIGPSDNLLRIRNEKLDKSFNGGSPYFDMYECGLYGVPIEDCISKCQSNGIAIRSKDIKAWEDGKYKHDLKTTGQAVPTKVTRTTHYGVPLDDAKLNDFPLIPNGWEGYENRFFPCNEYNKPLVKWGWSKEFIPVLYTRKEAEALSPCGWVGQNMLYQRFIVMDIDGRGHGEDDTTVIQFGRLFDTLTYEDPNKIGSFHLYFETDRLIPVRHFPYAKLDLMGNAVNAAVYFKNKVSNDKPMMKLDDSIWNAMMAYQKKRKELLCL